MKEVKSMTGSITSSLAGVNRHLRRFGHWFVRRNWLKLLKMAKLVVEIIKDTRNLLFWNEPWGICMSPGQEYRVASL